MNSVHYNLKVADRNRNVPTAEFFPDIKIHKPLNDVMFYSKAFANCEIGLYYRTADLPLCAYVDNVLHLNLSAVGKITAVFDTIF
jgi:hypothetical protein